MSVFDKRQCALGEGPLWHPERKQLFWFDILGKRLLSRTADGPLEWRFQNHVAVAGWVDHDTLIIVSETALLRFDIPTGKTSPLLDLEADKPATRPHDGRADPFGGLWIGTIGKGVEAGSGSLYRYYLGEITQLKTGMTLPNSICFSPDGRTAYYAETTERRVLRQPLDAQGWPMGAAQVLIDLSNEELRPDGATMDSDGCLWVACWNAGKVLRITAEGEIRGAVSLPALKLTRTEFGGSDLTTLFVTSGAMGSSEPHAGQTFAISSGAVGLAQPRVILG